MERTLKSVFDAVGQDVTFNTRLLKRINRYVTGFITKNDDSINFFGDALVGVHPIRYVADDRNLWFDEVLELDEFALKSEVHSLPTIDTNFHVSSDLVNLSFVWCMYRISKSKDLSAREKEKGLIDIVTMMHCKFLSSLMSHYFRYPADKSVALSTYTQLSRRFDLKIQGSWSKLIEFKAQGIISKKGIHYNTYQTFSADADVVYMVNDIQGRIREVVKAIMDVFYKVRESDGRIVSTSSVIDIEGESIVKDKTNDYIRFRKYLNSIITDRSTLIKKELLDIVSNAVHTMPVDHLESALEYCSDNYGVRGDKYVKPLVDEVIVHAFAYLDAQKVEPADLPNAISKLRSIYMSSRSNEKTLLELRDLGDQIVDDAIRSRNASVKASVRTGLLLYLVLRTLTMKHYS